MKAEEILKLAVDACDEKQAYDIATYDLTNAGLLYDYSVVCHAPTSRQVESIAAEVREKAMDNDLKIYGMEGLREAKWILMDLGDVVVNILTRDDREYYELDKLLEKYPLKEV